MKHLIALALMLIATTSFADETLRNINLLKVERFNKLSKADQNLYLKKVRIAFAEFEKSYDTHMTFAQNNRFMLNLIDEAYADDAPASNLLTPEQRAANDKVSAAIVSAGVNMTDSDPKHIKMLNNLNALRLKYIQTQSSSDLDALIRQIIEYKNVSSGRIMPDSERVPLSKTFHDAVGAPLGAAAAAAAASTLPPVTPAAANAAAAAQGPAKPGAPNPTASAAATPTANVPATGTAAGGRPLAGTPPPPAGAAQKPPAAAPATAPAPAAAIVQDYNDKECVIGGLVRPTHKNNGRNTCPTSERPCGDLGNNGFQCGKIYAEVCVKRFPPDNISKDCATAFDKLNEDEKAKKEAADKYKYAEEKKAIEDDYKSVCVAKDTIRGKQQQEACDALSKRFDQLAAEYGQGKLSDAEKKCNQDEQHKKFAVEISASAGEVTAKSPNCEVTSTVDWNLDTCKIQGAYLTVKGEATSSSAAKHVALDSETIDQAALTAKMRDALKDNPNCKEGTPVASADKHDCSSVQIAKQPALDDIRNKFRSVRDNCYFKIVPVFDNECKITAYNVDQFDNETAFNNFDQPHKIFDVPGQSTNGAIADLVANGGQWPKGTCVERNYSAGNIQLVPGQNPIHKSTK